MKLTLKIKLIADERQKRLLIETIIASNKICNQISDIAWKNKTFNQFKLHNLCYRYIKDSCNLSSQQIIRAISKVCDAYKKNKNNKCFFREKGAVTYDSRILNYRPNNTISIGTISGRLKIKYMCHEKQNINFIKGEGDLVFIKGKLFIHQTIEIQTLDKIQTKSYIGCDFGQTDICSLSDGTNFNSKELKRVRNHYLKIRSSIQRKGTKGAKKLLKRISGKESRFISISNHSISKQIICKAINEKKGIAIEDLKYIRTTAKTKNKLQKYALNNWSFSQLRRYIEYKSEKNNIPLFVVPSQYTSKTCSNCMVIGERMGKKFRCNKCNNKIDADLNAAINISKWGCIIAQPEEQSNLYCVYD